MKVKSVKVGKWKIGDGTPLFLLGPCVLESAGLLRKIARLLQRITNNTGARIILKASYDKANRTSIDSFRGCGVEEGCRLLAEIGGEFGFPVTTDVHTAEEAVTAAEWIDLLQVPAFLCRQTDLLLACASTGRAVNVKKGQFLAPWDIQPIAEKLRSKGCRNIVFTERGATFGYNNLVADMRSLPWIRKQGYPVVFDATHSVQRPGGLGKTSGGEGDLAPVLARAAMAAGCDAIFMETHPKPNQSLSDGPNMIPLNKLEPLVETLLSIHAAVQKPS